jgi:outer membrane protein TolC
LSPQIADLSIASVNAVYLPTLASTVGDQRQVSPPATLLTGNQAVTTSTAVANGQMKRNLPRGGGALDVTWNNNRVTTDSFFSNFSPAYNSTLTAEYTQPLLRGFRTDASRQQLVVMKRNRDISELQLQTTVTNILSNVRNAYWDLVSALDSIDVAQKSLDLARQLVQEDERRVAFGTMTQLDLTTARSREASEQHALVQAEGNRRTAELALKRLIVSGADDPIWQTTLDPVDRPDVLPQPVDVGAAVRRALGQHTDLQQARQQAAANLATYALLRDQTRPQADLVATYALAGLGGTKLIRSGSFLDTHVVEAIPGGFGDALSKLLAHDFPTWNVSVRISYPIGLNSMRAAAARAELQMKQVDMQIRRLEVEITTEVTSAAIQVRNNSDQLVAARRAREAAQQNLDAEQRRFQAGTSTNFLVVQAQRDLADIQNAELQAQVAYRKSLVDFDRSQQTTLQAAGVAIVSTALPPPSVGSSLPGGAQ